MPTKLPRLALTVSEHVRAALNDLADAMGKPASKVASELLEEMVPQLEGLAKVARAAKSGNRAAGQRALAQMFGDNMAEVMTAQQPDMFKPKGKGKAKA